MLIKTIYIYWAQGFENAHEIEFVENNESELEYS